MSDWALNRRDLPFEYNDDYIYDTLPLFFIFNLYMVKPSTFISKAIALPQVLHGV